MTRRTWTIKEKTLLEDQCKTMSVRELSCALNRTEQSVKTALVRYGLTMGSDGKFKPGCTHAKRTDRKPNSTSFRAGEQPANLLFDGAITDRKDGKYIRVGRGRWVQLKRHLWEKQNGPVPAGHVVAFKTGDECVIENLECITRAELARRNHDPEKTAETMRANWKTVRTLADVGATSSKLKLKVKRKQTKSSPMLIVDRDALENAGSRIY